MHLRYFFVFLLIFAIVFTLLPQNTVFAYSAKAYVLFSPEDNEVLLSCNKDEKMSMASTTKIMTALILCENGYLNKIVTVQKQAICEGTSVGLKPGDKIARENLLYAMLLESGNDAANAVAIDIAGNLKVFAELMNERAAKIGMKNTNFVTPSGLDDKNHFTTAYDMALLAATAMKNKSFSKAASTKIYRSIYNDENTIRTYSNHNRLLSSLDGAQGIKTGFTKKSGRCLVSSCKRMNKQLIAVTLNAPDDWNDHKNLYNYGFSLYTVVSLDPHFTFKPICVAGGKEKICELTYETVELTIKKDEEKHINYVIELPQFLLAPVRCSDEVGKIHYYNNGKIIATARILSASIIRAQKPKEKNIIDDIFNWVFIMLKLG